MKISIRIDCVIDGDLTLTAPHFNNLIELEISRMHRLFIFTIGSSVKKIVFKSGDCPNLRKLLIQSNSAIPL